MPSIGDLADALRACRPARGTYVVGVTGAVASGKTTLSTALATAIGTWPECRRAALACTDGFLRANADLAAAGLTMRKGFPESYDQQALREALGRVRTGPASFPGYSHVTYDVDPALTRTIASPDVLIVEGLGLAGAPLDTLVYLDAKEGDLAEWFSRRFLGLWEAGLVDDDSFYARFRNLDRAGARAMAEAVWTAINLPNLRANIASLRAVADIVVTKAADHAITTITVKDAPIPMPARR